MKKQTTATRISAFALLLLLGAAVSGCRFISGGESVPATATNNNTARTTQPAAADQPATKPADDAISARSAATIENKKRCGDCGV